VVAEPEPDSADAVAPPTGNSASRRSAFGSDFFGTGKPYGPRARLSRHLSSRPGTSCENRGVTSDGTSVPTLHWSDSSVEVHKLVVGPYDNNVFVVRCRSTGDAVLIDAANEHEKLLDISARLGVRRVLETHGHHDHIQAIPAMREAGYEVAVTALDAPMLGDLGYDVFVDHDDVIEVGRLRLRSILNPGHTPGSISFRVLETPLLFTGDTLFPGGPGATKFPGGDFDTIIDSIDNLLFVHPADTIVLPGHGSDTTIGAERPHLKEWVDRGW
jgi:glyoxylase-like metal-dependent hydrolase (beta-lactamase superfamily II)